MTLAAKIERNRHAAKNERPRCDQAMRVVTDTDAKHTERGSWVFGLCTLCFGPCCVGLGARSLKASTRKRTKFKFQESTFRVQSSKFNDGYSATLPPAPDLPAW